MAATDVRNDQTYNGNELRNFRLEILGAHFVSPQTGQPWYRTTDNGAYYWNGTDNVAMDARLRDGIPITNLGTMATASFVGRNTAGTGAAEVLSTATVKTILGLNGTNSGDQTITLTGDATGSGTGSFAVTVARINGATLGTTTATSGNLLIGSGSAWVTQPITGDITISSAGVTAIGSGVIINADINASAAIALSKLAAVSSAQVLLGNGSGVVTGTSVTGDVTISNTGVTAIAAGAIVDADINASAAIALSKLATNPLARANHTGTQLANTISDFDTQVRTSRTDQLAVPTGNLSIGSQKIVSLADGVNPNDGVNVQQLTAAINGIANNKKTKDSVDIATFFNLPANYANGTAGVGATLTAISNGVLLLDGYNPTVGQRVLVRHHATAAYTGIYVVTSVGSVGTPFVLTRATDMDQATEFSGAVVAVENNGVTSGGGIWMCSCADSITVGTTSLSWINLNPVATFNSPTNSILVSGSNIDVNPEVPPTGVAAIETRVGGLGLVNVATAFDNASLVGNGVATTFNIAHNLNTRGVYAVVRDAAGNQVVVGQNSNNVNTLVITVKPALANAVVWDLVLFAKV